MNRLQIERALYETERKIVGLRSANRRQYTGTEKSKPCRWPKESMAAMRVLKDQAKQYRAMLAGHPEQEPNR